jgi:hypothetical protein
MLGPDPKFGELTHCVRLQVDAHSERLEVLHRLEHETRHTNLMQRERNRQSSYAAPGNEDRSMVHGRA